jgi:hypothetical protein
VLVELHRVVDQFEVICDEMFDASDLDGVGAATANRELCIMGDLSWHLLEASDELNAWHRLGNEIGLRQYFLKAGTDGEAGHDPNRLRRIRELIHGLPAKDPTIKAIKASLAKVPVTVREALDLFLEFSHVDNQPRAQLANRLAPEQVLVLERESLTFFGETRALTTFPQSEMACLWILVERAGRPVTRLEIIREGSLQTDEDNLKSTISRLRKRLKQIVKAYCRRTGNAQPRGFNHGFIRGERQRQYDPGHYGRGPYTLDLEPGRVRVQGPRPTWMRDTIQQ